MSRFQSRWCLEGPPCNTPPVGVCTLVLVAGLVAASCEQGVIVDEAEALTAEAKANYPTALDLHQKIVSRSCAPNAGVCHDTSNYPELSTPAAFIATINSWCNLAIPDPRQGFDACERRGDMLVSGDFRAEVAFVTRTGEDTFELRLRSGPARTAAVAPVRFERDDVVVFDPLPTWGVTVGLVEGNNVVTLRIGIDEPAFTEPFIVDALSGLVQGDANDNGVFGAHEAIVDERGPDAGVARIIAPGNLTRSYLWGRITGTVPGSRMPLANQALSDAEYVAVACFIEGLERVSGGPADIDLTAAINYDACAYARAPEHFAIDTP